MERRHLLRLRFGNQGAAYRVVCPYDDELLPDEQPPRCRPTGTGFGQPCLVEGHLAGHGLTSTWVGPDVPITAADTLLDVTWTDDGHPRISPARPDYGVPPHEIAAEQLAYASGFIRYRHGDKWRLLLASEADVLVAYNHAVKRGVGQAEEDTLRRWRDQLLAWHHAQQRDGAACG